MQDATLEKYVHEAGVVSQDLMTIALAQSRKSRVSLEEVLLSHGFVTRQWLCDLYGRSNKVKTVSLVSFVPDEHAVSLLPASIARRHSVLPLSAVPEKRTLCVAMAQAGDIVALDEIRTVLPAHWVLEVKLAVLHEIFTSLDLCYGVELSIDGILAELDGETQEESGQPFSGLADAAASYAQPVVRLIDALLVDAVRRKASDIHLEPEQHYLCIRYRIDGVLQQVRSLQSSYWPAMLVRLKVMCGLNIAETRSPQDGHLSLMLQARDIDFRISTFPTLHGENVVLRLLDKQTTLKPLSQLGLSTDHFNSITEKINASQGLIVVTGPTGSGKTTTLYSMLNHIQADQKNIMTLEDPVEYVLPSIRQCAVSEAVNLDFASGLRGLLRQDPDVILVGETRDAETCSSVIRAALTGHLVLTTLHSSSVLSTLHRIQALGVKLEHLNEVLLMVVAQRLVRKLCTVCREPCPVPKALGELLPKTTTIFRPTGCIHCRGSGYRGRQVVMELYIPDGSKCTFIAAETKAGIRAQTNVSNFHSLESNGLELVRQGVTSLSELQRVINFSATPCKQMPFIGTSA